MENKFRIFAYVNVMLDGCRGGGAVVPTTPVSVSADAALRA